MINKQNTQMVSLLLESLAETASSSRNNDLQDLMDVLALVSDVSSSSSDSEEFEFDLVQHLKVNNFVNTIDEFDEENFKSHMRLRRQTIEYLISRYSEFECGNRLNVHRGRSKVDSRKSVYIYIWYISNTVTFRQLGNLFGVAWNIVRIVTSFSNRITHEYVQWPQGAAAEKAKAKFKGKKRIPGIIGAIDCTHIGIKASKLNKECYFDRKQTYSIVLQAIVDANKRFINISCGEPGSLHDSRVLRRSEIYTKAQTQCLQCKGI